MRNPAGPVAPISPRCPRSTLPSGGPYGAAGGGARSPGYPHVPNESIAERIDERGQGAVLVAGDLSGIQEYLFDLAHEGGAQARRLRARSFFIQMLAEAAMLRIRRAAGYGPEHLLFCGAGKFILGGPTLDAEQRGRVEQERLALEEWLLDETGAQLRFSLVLSEAGGSAVEVHAAAMDALQREKLRPWSRLAISGTQWVVQRLVLQPLDSPCVLCRHRTGVCPEIDEETGEPRLVCARCHSDKELGTRLPRARWLALRQTPGPSDLAIGGLGVSVSEGPPDPLDPEVLAVANLQDPSRSPAGCPPEKVLGRPLARHIPADADGGPLEFSELARRAQGDRLLGVLKMDGDSVGLEMRKLLVEENGLASLGRFSHDLDEFMAGTLDAELRKPEWMLIYTVFAGGDDLLVVGPWNLVLDYAGHVGDLFASRFGHQGLTMSAGMALLKPRRPVKRAVEEAASLLKSAKEQRASGASLPKDQMAALGQVWKWRDHEAIVGAGKRLAGWVDSGAAERGWLHTLLELARLRRGELARAGDTPHRATARLAYHVARNWPPLNDRRTRQDPDKVALRQWGDRIIEDFDDMTGTETYFPHI